jgi:hypothetical protein
VRRAASAFRKNGQLFQDTLRGTLTASGRQIRSVRLMLEYAEKSHLYMTVVIFMGQIVPVKSAGSKRQFERNWQFAQLYVQEAAFARPFYASGCVSGRHAHIWRACLRAKTLTLKLGQARFL